MTAHGTKFVGTIAEMGGVITVPTPFHRAVLQMAQYNAQYLVNPGEAVFYDAANNSYHSFARNALADNMRGDWLLMLDTDHTFEPDLAARMLATMNRHQIDVLSAMYVYRNPPHNPVMFVRMPDGNLRFLGDWDRKKKIDVMEIGAGGGGSLMIRRSVFTRIRKDLKENPFSIANDMSEDLSFFDRLRRLDIKAYVALGIESQHLTWKPLGLADYHVESALVDTDHRVIREGKA